MSVSVLLRARTHTYLYIAPVQFAQKSAIPLTLRSDAKPKPRQQIWAKRRRINTGINHVCQTAVIMVGSFSPKEH